MLFFTMMMGWKKSISLAQVSNILASLGHTGRKRVGLGYTLNTQTLMRTKKSHNDLSKFTLLCWATCSPWAAGWAPLESVQ